ncbi:hypothetical protein EV562_111209 [Streptomyces sp. BK208]|nr:hypothetical protein EV562_111209 [Streptomyces sp. BK208]
MTGVVRVALIHRAQLVVFAYESGLVSVRGA